MNRNEINQAVWDSQLTGSSKLLALCLIRHAFAENCEVPKSLIMLETNLSKKTIRKHIEQLEAHGWLIVQRSGGGKPNRYTMTLPPA
jgi:predicted transcriptional regulator